MMIGEYPCCDGPLFLPLPEDRPLPTFAPETCPHCGAKVWHKFSRVNPQSWTEAGFLAEFDVDAEARTITPKAGMAGEPPPAVMDQQWLNEILHGTPGVHSSEPPVGPGLLADAIAVSDRS